MKAFYLATLLCTFFKLPLDGGVRYILTAERNATKSEIKFVKQCLCQQNIGELFSLEKEEASKKNSDTAGVTIIKASISIEHEVKSPRHCTGIYYYKLYSRFWKTARFRDAEFMRAFCIVDKKLITFSRDSTENKRIYNSIEGQLIRDLGRETTQKERACLLQGGAYFR